VVTGNDVNLFPIPLVAQKVPQTVKEIAIVFKAALVR
jgi:hypothetical protein